MLICLYLSLYVVRIANYNRRELQIRTSGVYGNSKKTLPHCGLNLQSLSKMLLTRELRVKPAMTKRKNGF